MKKSILRKLTGSLVKLVFPALLVIILATIGGAVWLVHRASAEPPRTAYLVTPERLTEFTNNGGKFTEETWTNADKTVSRGWLVRGANGTAAVILLHRYGADRSWLLNMGVKMQQAGFTVLIPDLRGHGENPAVKQSSFGGCEADDLASAIQFLRGLKAEGGANIVGQKIGVYGVEQGAVAAMLGSANQPDVAALALDSVPASPADVLQTVVASRASFAAAAVAPVVGTAAPLYFLNGCYKNGGLCESAAALANRKILLLAGADAPHWQESTNKLASCFTNAANLQKKTDLQPSGYNIVKSSTPEQQESYNNIIVEFFRASLAN